MNPILKIRRRLGLPSCFVPRYQSKQASGLDLYAANEDPIIVGPGHVVIVPTGLYVEIPAGYEGQIRARSGLSSAHGLMLPNSPGTVDADYRGEVKVILGNCGAGPFTIWHGRRFAQLVICPVARVEIVEVWRLADTERGEGGFGHTGG